jgi:hypothetical protein
VFVSQSPAEYGWTAGGAVSMATKSGTNQFHGEGFEFYRNKALNAIDPFAKAAGQAKPTSAASIRRRDRRPIVKDRITSSRRRSPEEQPVRHGVGAAPAVLRKPERDLREP